MPTPSRPGPKDNRSLSAASVLRPGGGGSGGNAVNDLIQQADQQSQAFQKLLKTVEKLQQENAETVADAGLSAASAATEVANKVAANVERENLKADRKRERLEDREESRDFAEFRIELEKEAQTEIQKIGASLVAQRDAMSRYTDNWRQKKADMDESIEAFSATTDELLASGHFDNTKGRAELKKRLHLINMMRANSDDHFDDRHLEAAFRDHNKFVQEIISGGDPRDISTMQVQPLLLPLGETTPSGKTIAPEDSVSPEKMFEMKIMGGYPEKGVVFNDEENFGLPAGYSPRLVDAELMLEVMSRDDTFRFMQDASIRRELTRKNQELVVQALDRLEPLRDQYKSFNSTFNAMAPGAINASIKEFVNSTDPHKFDDVGRTLTSGAIKHVFGGGSKGEQMALNALKLFDGKSEMNTPEQAFVAMALESAVFNIKTHMLSEIQGSAAGGSSLSTLLVKQMVDQIGEEGVSELLGVPNTGVGLVNAQDVMQQRLTDSYSFANRMHEGLWRQSTLEDFRKDLRKHTRMADLFAFKQLSADGDQQGRILSLLGQEEAFEGIEEDIKGQSPVDLESLVSEGTSPAITEDLNMLDAMIKLGEELGPDQLNAVSAMMTAGASPIDTPNLQTYLNETRTARERSGYVKAASARARFNFDRQQKAKEASAKGETPAFTLPPSLISGARAAGAAVSSPITSAIRGNLVRDFSTGLDFLTGNLPEQKGPLDLQGAIRGKAFQTFNDKEKP